MRGRCRHHRPAPRIEGAKPSGRQALADSTGISPTLILEWVNHVDLWRINGVGSEYSDLLEAAGVDSPAELATAQRREPRHHLPGSRCGSPGLDPADCRPRRRWPTGSPRRSTCRASSSIRSARRIEPGQPPARTPTRLRAAQRRAQAVISEFKGFLLKTNALALAVGVIIGGALGTVVNSLVNDIIMPPIGMVLGGVDFSQLKVVLKEAAGGDPATEVAIRYGAVPQRDHRVRRDRVRRLADLEDVHQGRDRRRGQDLSVLQGSERGRRHEVQGLRQLDLIRRGSARRAPSASHRRRRPSRRDHPSGCR